MVGVLSLLWLIPFVGALIVWGIGTSQLTAKFIALGFSLVEMVLATSLLLAFINPGWAFVLGAPTATPPPTPGPFVPLFYMERFGGWKDYGFNYIVGVDGLSVPLIWLTALLTTLAIVFHWDEEQRPRAFFGLFMFLEMALVGVFQALDFILFAVFWELVLLPMFFLIGIWGGPNRRYAALKFLIFTHVGFVIMLLSMFTLYWTASPSVHAAVYACRAWPRVGPRHPGDRLDGLRGLRVPRPDGPEAAQRIQLRGPHGLRPPRGVEPHRDRGAGRDLPALQPRDHHRDSVHARGLLEAQHGDAGHSGAARARAGD